MRQQLIENAKKGLASANRGNPFWTQSQAMTVFNEIRNCKTVAEQEKRFAWYWVNASRLEGNQ